MTLPLRAHDHAIRQPKAPSIFCACGSALILHGDGYPCTFCGVAYVPVWRCVRFDGSAPPAQVAEPLLSDTVAEELGA